MHKPSILVQNRCCAIRKRAIGSLSLMMADRDECRWVVLCRGVGHQEFVQRIVTHEQKWSRGCDEWTKLRVRPEDRDAWTKVVKRVVTNGQNQELVQVVRNVRFEQKTVTLSRCE